MSPATVTQGNPRFTITVTGTNFASNHSVTVDGFRVATTYISPTVLQGVVPARFLANAGQALVAVRDPLDNGSNQAILTIVPPPAIVSATPQDVPAGSPGFTLTAVGSRFVPGCKVRVGATPLPTTYVASNQLTAAAPASLLVSSGRSDIAVVAPDGPVSNLAALIVREGRLLYDARKVAA